MADQASLGLILQFTLLLILANGSPVLAKGIFGKRFSYPLDAGRIMSDGRPLFGASKTIRGVVSAVVVTAIGAALIGQGIANGALLGVTAMVGDLISSFIKRRLGLPTSSRATLLDQVPESLLPLLACSYFVPLSSLDIALTMVIFVVGEIILSPLLYSARIRDKPY
jgi:CDP-2,3-bis-(O-geranylgeranyl)-sn-glycerol synthase